MFARQAGGFVSGAGSPKSPVPRLGGVRSAIRQHSWLCRSRRRISAGSWRRGRLCRIQNTTAGFAGLQFEIFRSVHFLVDVGKQSHSAAAALLVYGGSERDAVVAFSCARVHIENFFRNLLGDFFPKRNIRLHFAVYFAGVVFNFLTLRGDGLLRFAQRGFRCLHIFFGFFGGHHLFQLDVFKLSHFGFSIGDFVQQCFVGLVGFYRGGLRAEFFGAFAPFGNFKFGFLAPADNV